MSLTRATPEILRKVVIARRLPILRQMNADTTFIDKTQSCCQLNVKWTIGSHFHRGARPQESIAFNGNSTGYTPTVRIEMVVGGTV